MLVNNVDKLQYVDELVYFYVNQPIRIMRIYEQVHMAKVFCLETKKNVIIDKVTYLIFLFIFLLKKSADENNN